MNGAEDLIFLSVSILIKLHTLSEYGSAEVSLTSGSDSLFTYGIVQTASKIQFWARQSQKDVREVEEIQKKVMQMIKSLEGLIYKEKLD